MGASAEGVFGAMSGETDPGSGDTGKPAKPIAVVVLLIITMFSAVYLRSGLSVLPLFIFDDFGITRSQFGSIFAVFAISGAVLSPIMGSLVDGSSRRSLMAVFAFAIAGTLVAVGAPSFIWALVAAGVAGIALAAGNASTNRVVAERIAIEWRGPVTGLKQSGPQITLLVVGAALPAIAVMWNWRIALLTGVVVPMVGLVLTAKLIDRNTPVRRRDRRPLRSTERRTITWLAIEAFFMGIALASVQAFLPLYALEEVAMSPSMAGFMAALLGFGGLVGRTFWTTIENRFESRVALLAWMPVGAAGTTILLASANADTQWLLVVGAFVAGLVMLAWPAVGWLFVINTSHPESIGKASSVMQIGTFSGWAIGPVVMGYLVDTSDAYTSSWVMLLVLFIVIAMMSLRLRRYLSAQEADASAHGSG